MLEQPEDYLRWILAQVQPTDSMQVGIAAAHGLVLAAPVASRLDLPLWDASAMDGYALRAADVMAASPTTPAELRVIGEVAAGSLADPALAPGEAVRIMTGAPVPSEADTVVPFEQTIADNDASPWAESLVRVTEAVPVGAHVRRQGEDVRAGDPLADAGDALGAARLSALAAAGVDVVDVYRTPRVAVVSTGSELRAPGERLQRGEIPESNSLLVSGLLRETGIAPVTVEHCADDADQLRERLAELAATHDAVITTGGVGPGRHDVVRIALEGEPGIRSLSVAVRPGQPQCSGRHSAGGLAFGLPGNPVSAAVSFELFVRPALRALGGHATTERRRHTATVIAGWRGRTGRLQVQPVTIVANETGLVCSPAVPSRGVSHSVGRHGATDGYALVEPERGDVSAGDTVHVILTGLP